MKKRIQYCFIFAVMLLGCLAPFALHTISLSKLLFVATNVLSSLIIIGCIIFSKELDLFSPLTFILINVFFGMTFRSIYMVTNADAWDVQNKLLINQDFDFFIFPSVIMCFSVMFFSLGFKLPLPRLQLDKVKFLRADNWNQISLEFIVVVLGVTGIIFSYLFLEKTGFASFYDNLELSNLSKKRFVEIGGKKAAFGYYRFMASLVQFAFYFYFAWFIKHGLALFSLRGGALIFLGFMSLLFPIITNSRAGLVLTFVTILMIWYYLRGLEFRVTLPIIGLSIFFTLFLSISRKNQLSSIDSFRDVALFELLAETFGGGRHYLGVAKTAHIMEAVPNDLPYAYGSTFLEWVFAPIPRELWPEKPALGHGPLIIEKALHGNYQRNGGVPPGLLGELFWNFGYIGMLSGMFLFGSFLKFIYLSFKQYLDSNLNILMLYIGVCTGFAFYLPNSSVSIGIISVLKSIIPTIIIIYLASIRLK